MCVCVCVSAWSRCNSHNIWFHHLKCTDQFLVYSQSSASPQWVLEPCNHPKKKPGSHSQSLKGQVFKLGLYSPSLCWRQSQVITHSKGREALPIWWTFPLYSPLSFYCYAQNCLHLQSSVALRETPSFSCLKGETWVTFNAQCRTLAGLENWRKLRIWRTLLCFIYNGAWEIRLCPGEAVNRSHTLVPKEEEAAGWHRWSWYQL